MKPTLAAPRGPWNGTPEIDRASEAPIKEAISGLIFLSDDKTVLEEDPLERVSKAGELMAYKHEGFWQCMDTKRDKDLLEEFSKQKVPPWNNR